MDNAKEGQYRKASSPGQNRLSFANPNFHLNSFCAAYPPRESLERPNTTPLFVVFDPSAPELIETPSPFERGAWRKLLEHYPGRLPILINGILKYGCLLGYTGEKVKKGCKNLSTADLDPEAMSRMLAGDIVLKRVQETSIDEFPLRLSPLGFVPKATGGLRRIHHLSSPRASGTNAGIDSEHAYLAYARVQDVITDIITAGKGCFIIKRDMEAAFRNIPVAAQDQWLLGFKWDGKVFKERCLPFGLRTAPMLFNLFAEALHWILHAWLGWDLVNHLLDDVVHIVPFKERDTIPRRLAGYILVTDVLGIPRNSEKDECGQEVIVFGYELDTVRSVMRLPAAKRIKLQSRAQDALIGGQLSLWETQVLAGLMSWSAPAVQLGWVFCRRIWDFERRFNIHQPRQRLPLPLEVREDLTWWSTLLLTFNGTRFFDDASRTPFHLFTDASGVGMGGFFYAGGSSNWKENIRLTSRENSYSMAIPQRELILPLDINVFEVQAVGQAIRRWGRRWSGQHVLIHTDNAATFYGIGKGSIASLANRHLRLLLCEAAQMDIKLTPLWLAGATNELADALSRFRFEIIANWCPHW
jgi:hypothetical protein